DHDGQARLHRTGRGRRGGGRRAAHAELSSADHGDDLSAPEQDEVAVPPERSVRYRRRPFLARSIWRFIWRFIGIASDCSVVASRYAARSSRLRRDSACAARCGSRATPARSIFLTALASSGFCRSSAACDAFRIPLPTSGSFIRKPTIGFRYLPPATRPSSAKIPSTSRT